MSCSAESAPGKNKLQTNLFDHGSQDVHLLSFFLHGTLLICRKILSETLQSPGCHPEKLGKVERKQGVVRDHQKALKSKAGPEQCQRGVEIPSFVLGLR